MQMHISEKLYEGIDKCLVLQDKPHTPTLSAAVTVKREFYLFLNFILVLFKKTFELIILHRVGGCGSGPPHHILH